MCRPYGDLPSAFTGRWYVLTLCGFFGVAAVMLLVQVVAGDGTLIDPFVLFLLFAVGWNAYWWLLRIVYSLTLHDGTLEWATPLGRGRIPVTDLTAVRPMRFLPGLVAIKHTGGQPLVVLQVKGMTGFAAELRESRPDLEVRTGAGGWFQERMPGPSAWRQDN